MTKRNDDDRANLDVKIKRAIERLIDEALDAVAQGTREGIRARVAGMSREQLELRLIEAAGGLLLSNIDGAELGDNIINNIIRTLRRAFPDRSTPDLELLLADARDDAVHRLGEFVDGLIDCHSFIDDVIDVLVTEEAADQARDLP